MDKTLDLIKKQSFISMSDLQVILGGDEISSSMAKRYYSLIRKYAIEEIVKVGKIPPKKTLIPAVYVWQYLEPYGISKNS